MPEQQGESLPIIRSLGRMEVTFGTVSAVAGVVERDGQWEIAFRGPLRKLGGVADGVVGGKAVRVVSPFVSSTVRADMVEAVVEPAAGDE